MDGTQIFVTGDYWHPDFVPVISEMNMTTTMVPPEQVDRYDFASASFSLVLIVQSRRSQVPEAVVEHLRSTLPNCPLILLKGSLCEGETRSGEPLTGVIPVFWHQWRGRFKTFKVQLARHGLTDWHTPATSTVADRLKHHSANAADFTTSHGGSKCVGVSAWSQENFDFMRDALTANNWNARWIERTRWDADTTGMLQAICIDANSVTDDLKHRIVWISNSFPGVPLVLVLNFPRRDEVTRAAQLGVSEVVSKPFELTDLTNAVVRAVDVAVNRTRTSSEDF